MAKSKVKKLVREPGIADFGGDEVKMALQKAIDAGAPQTRIRFTLEGEAEKAWREKRNGNLAASVIAVNLARLYEAGKVSGSKTKEGTVEITVSDPKILATVAKMRDEYHASQSVGRDDAMVILKAGRERVAHLREKNQDLDFGPATEALTTAQTAFNAHALKADGDTLDYRPVDAKVREAVKTAEDLVAESIAAGISRMDAGPDAEAKLAAAMATTDLQGRRNALLSLRHLLVGMGYSDPEFVSKRQPETNGRHGGGNQPHRRREGGPPPKRFQRPQF